MWLIFWLGFAFGVMFGVVVMDIPAESREVE